LIVESNHGRVCLTRPWHFYLHRPHMRNCLVARGSATGSGFRRAIGAGLLATQRQKFRGIRSAHSANLPNSKEKTRNQHTHKDAQQRSRPLLHGPGKHPHHPPSIGHTEPSNQGVPQAARRAEDEEEAPARDAQSARGKCKRQQRNRRWKQSGKKNSQDPVTLDPSDHWPKKTRRDVVLQRRFTASAANMPRGVSAQDAARNCNRRQQPGIATMRHQPKQQQVRAAGQRQGNDRGIDDRNQEQAQRSQMDQPARHHLRANRDRLQRSWW